MALVSVAVLAAVVAEAVPVVAEDRHRVRRWLLKLALQNPLPTAQAPALNLVHRAAPTLLDFLATSTL